MIWYQDNDSAIILYDSFVLLKDDGQRSLFEKNPAEWFDKNHIYVNDSVWIWTMNKFI